MGGASWLLTYRINQEPTNPNVVSIELGPALSRSLQVFQPSLDLKMGLHPSRLEPLTDHS